MDKLFDTDKKRESALITIQEGIRTPFWLLMEQMLEADVTSLKELILAGVDREGQSASKEVIDGLRDCLKVYQDLLDTPSKMIERFNQVEGEEPSLDPYPTLKEERNKLKG